MTKDGEVISGDAVTRMAASRPSNYAVSSNLDEPITERFLINLKESLDRLSDSCDTLLLSSEMFSNRTRRFKVMDEVLSGFEVEIIMIIRPPVQWFNSAWWQWFQWEKLYRGTNGVDLCVAKRNVARTWLRKINRFEALNCVKQFNLLALNKSFMMDVINILGINQKLVHFEGSNKAHNTASSSELLNFLKLKRSLRPDNTMSKTEFVLNKYLKPRSKSDWVLTSQNVEDLLSKTKEPCLELAKRITNENILDNPAWWDSNFYTEKCQNVVRKNALKHEQLADMLEEAYQVIIKLDDSIRESEKRAKSTKEFVDGATSLIKNAEKLSKTDLEGAIELLELAQQARPNGKEIENKLEEYRQRKEASALHKFSHFIQELPRLAINAIR